MIITFIWINSFKNLNFFLFNSTHWKWCVALVLVITSYLVTIVINSNINHVNTQYQLRNVFFNENRKTMLFESINGLLLFFLLYSDAIASCAFVICIAFNFITAFDCYSWTIFVTHSLKPQKCVLCTWKGMIWLRIPW